ncbi:hypothetical protein ACLBXJ_02825 [Methylobacterium mesophilicum]|uniref:hypothetical protein n=1 Tax=Methylobacterium mesophilicum TaxID=39956 RepID=UPI001EE1FE86|nr:hypothetical protein [Methylobacterium mesophilicum]GJE21770.1 hypothetical protein JHFBIEKO_2218 [Methylobacterium mesophilicum]
MASNPTVSDLLKSKEVTDAQVSAAVDAVLANAKIGPFELASGWVLDVTAAVKADRHATATLKEPTARPGSKRAAVKSAILLAHPVKG